jgi:hypothetical protein
VIDVARDPAGKIFLLKCLAAFSVPISFATNKEGVICYVSGHSQLVEKMSAFC